MRPIWASRRRSTKAVGLARSEGFGWLATFDQDSLIPPGAFAGLLDIHRRHPQREQIAILALPHRDRATGQATLHAWSTLEQAAEWTSLRDVITSGCLIALTTFAQVGLFDERLFIDAVDLDFSLRCRERGLLIIEGRSTPMAHSLGQIQEHCWLFLRVRTTNHSPQRRYFITRNHLYVFFRYRKVDWRWAWLGLMVLLLESVAVVAFERQRWQKARAICHGLADFLRRRFGPGPAAWRGRRQCMGALR